MLPSRALVNNLGVILNHTGSNKFAILKNYNRVPKSGVVAVTSSGVVELVSRQSFQDTFVNDL
jgi:hypothetical protein